ncbi:MAG: O-antigen ligase family protein [Archangiaceae bacterium]|nr:O-antigen ligase family protein [Archangiaceae bacterium]
MPPRRSGRRLNHAGRWLLASAAFAAPLCIGGVPNWVAWLCAPIAFTALGLAVATRSDLKLPLFVLVPFGVAALCALQLVPMPPALLSVVSPPSAGLREFALVPLGLDGWRPISLDTGATWRELGKHLLYAGAFLAAVHLASASRGARTILVGAIAVSGTVVLSLAVIHPLLGLDSLFGLYRFSSPTRLFTSFGNVNHLAGFLILCGILSVGLAIEAADRRFRALWLVSSAICSVGVLLSLSRAGIAAYCAGLLLFLIAIIATRHNRTPVDGEDLTTTALRWGGVALSVVVIGSFLLFDKLIERFKDTPTYALKLQIWPSAAAAAGEFWRTGMGRGVFEQGFTRFMPDHLGKTYTHPENFVLQLSSELGLLAAALVIALSVVALIAQVRGASALRSSSPSPSPQWRWCCTTSSTSVSSTPVSRSPSPSRSASVREKPTGSGRCGYRGPGCWWGRSPPLPRWRSSWGAAPCVRKSRPCLPATRWPPPPPTCGGRRCR